MAMEPGECKMGTPVWYSPGTDGPRFSAVVAGEVRMLGQTPVVYLRGLPPAYGEYRQAPRTTVPAAALFALTPRETERPVIDTPVDVLERALAFVAEFKGDERCGLNCFYSEALAAEVIHLREKILLLQRLAADEQQHAKPRPMNAGGPALALRCDGRYPVPQTSPPRDEPFQVTYRCAGLQGHDGPCGAEAMRQQVTGANDTVPSRDNHLSLAIVDEIRQRLTGPLGVFKEWRTWEAPRGNDAIDTLLADIAADLRRRGSVFDSLRIIIADMRRPENNPRDYDGVPYADALEALLPAPPEPRP